MPMTLDDLQKSLNNFMPEWCDIEQDEDGQIVIRTHLVERDGYLVPTDEADDE